LKIRDLVDVIPQPTVVRLEHLQGKDAGWISDSYYITEETENHLKALRVLFSRNEGCGVFLIGHYGSGKSHFLAYVAQQLQAGNIAARAPSVVTLSLLNYKASQSLESILDDGLAAPRGTNDRREVWNEIGKRFPNGVLLVLDELSEFLRAKPTPQSFNEDLRFLQFLGEWAQEHPLWILAALQEQIEHTGEIEYDLFRKIKDRYPMRLLLTAAHVKDLIAQRILRKKPEYRSQVEKLARELKEIYADSSVDYAAFCELYPLHPSTLELLEEVRDRFSQARGIVEFTLTRLLGDEARGVAPFLDEPWGHLLTPDVIVDHFADLFEVQPEFLAIAQKVLPYYRKHIPTLFEADLQRDLAWRLLKLLILVHLSPGREALDQEEAAQWLLLKVSSVDPARNREVVKRILDILCAQGAFLKKKGTGYCLDLQDDSKQYLDQQLSKAVDELKLRGDYVFELLVPCLQQAEFNPFVLPRDRWQVRRVRWHFHDWDLHVYFGGGVPPEQKGLALQVGLPWGPVPEGDHCFRILPSRLEHTAEIFELAALHYLKEKPLPSRVLGRIQERITGRSSWFRSLVRTACNESVVLDPDGNKSSPPLTSMQGGVAAWLSSHGESILRQTYPQFERFAPTYGPLPKEAYRQFMKFASEHDLGAELAPDYVKLIREAYLLPMGLMQRRGSDYVVIPKLENHDLVRLLTPILGHHPTPARVYQHLSAPVYGLVPDQIQLLLTVLLVQGEIDIVKGDRSYREFYETLPNPLHYDRILPGQALNLNQLRDLQVLCEGFHVPIPKQWSVLAQKRAIEQLRRFGSRQRDILSEFANRLKASGEGDKLAGQFENVISHWLALEKGDHELQGFEHFIFAIGSPQRFVAEAAEMASLPARYERLLRESQRFRHLFGYSCLAQCADPDIAVRLEALGQPPALDQPADLESWLRRAQDLYKSYAEWYREQHEAWRNSSGRHPIWNYHAPAVSASRHVGGAKLVRELETLQAEARAARCAGLASLDFQPLCRCGFDGATSLLAPILIRFESAASSLEKELGLFSQQDKVKARIRDWVEQKIEINPKTLSYLEDKADYPQIDNLELFDQHLSGLELTQTLEPEALLDLIGERVWEKSALIRALDQFLDRLGPRIAIRREEPRVRKDLVSWCCEQALRQGCPLPGGFSASEHALIPGLIQPTWLSEASLQNLESLGLKESAIQRILELLLTGVVRPPENRPSAGPITAAIELLRPRQPSTPEQLAELAARLYEQHERFVKLRPQLWLSRLQELAGTMLQEMPERLERLLQGYVESHWIVIDCLGLPLLDTMRQMLPGCLPAWKLQKVEFGLVSEQSSTEAFYLGLIGRDFKKAFEKINAIDALIHGRTLAFPELQKLSCTELEIAFRKLRDKIDPSVPLIVFGDHGFRLALDGGGFTHGGPSTLERIVPLFVLTPG